MRGCTPANVCKNSSAWRSRQGRRCGRPRQARRQGFRLAKAFGMNDRMEPEPDAGAMQEVASSYATKEELFSTADIVTIHVVLSQRRTDWSGWRIWPALKPTGCLVNTARGPIRRRAPRCCKRCSRRRSPRRNRRVLGRAAAGRSSVPQTRQHRADATSRLRHRRRISQPLWPDGRRHRRLVQGRAAAKIGLAVTHRRNAHSRHCEMTGSAPQ